MTQPVMRAIYPGLTVTLVAALAMAVWALEREMWFVWVGVSVLLPIAWAAFELPRKEPSDEIRRGIFFASFLLAFPLAFAIGDSLGLYNSDEYSIASVALGFLMGSVLIYMGNTIPKRLPPLDEDKFDAAKVQQVQRFAGWAFVLAGIGYILAWLILPTVPANIVATGLTLIATALILGRRILTRIHR